MELGHGMANCYGRPVLWYLTLRIWADHLVLISIADRGQGYSVSGFVDKYTTIGCNISLKVRICFKHQSPTLMLSLDWSV
jgi:hypothetical protein